MSLGCSLGNGVPTNGVSCNGGGNRGNGPNGLFYHLSCDNEVKIVKFRYNFLLHNIFERINGELEKLIKCPPFEIPIGDDDAREAADGDSGSSKVKCMFSIDFNATTENQSMIGAYMHNCTNVPRWYKFSVSVRDVNGTLKHTAEVSTKRMEPESGWGLASFCSKHTLNKNRDTLCPRGTLNVQFDVCLLVPQTIRADLEPKKAVAKKSPALTAAAAAETRRMELARDLIKLLDNKSLSDVTLICRAGVDNDDPDKAKETRLPAHKAVLGARSPVFSAMFSHPGLKEGSTSEVAIDDVDGDTMQTFLEFVYGKETFLSDFDTAAAVMAVADKYNVPGLLHLCEGVMVSTLRLSNCARGAIAGHLYNSEPLKRAAMAMMMQYGKRLKEMDGWDEIKKEHPTLMHDIVDYMLDVIEIA